MYWFKSWSSLHVIHMMPSSSTQHRQCCHLPVTWLLQCPLLVHSGIDSLPFDYSCFQNYKGNVYLFCGFKCCFDFVDNTACTTGSLNKATLYSTQVVTCDPVAVLQSLLSVIYHQIVRPSLTTVILVPISWNRISFWSYPHQGGVSLRLITICDHWK